jgi:hypothetical protein
MKFLSLIALFALPAVAQTLHLEEFNYQVPDIREKNLTKETLFHQMDRTLVRVKDSICSNRAHVWSYQLKKKDIVAPKIFLFFTPKTARFDGVTWWHHVAPLVNENGQLWVMDAGFPKRIKSPLSIEAWLNKFDAKVCKEIGPRDLDLVDRMFRTVAFPQSTAHGKFDCYYKIAPAGYWTPNQLAKNLSGKDENERPVRFHREEIVTSEVMEACMEVSTSPWNWVLKRSARCRNFIRH